MSHRRDPDAVAPIGLHDPVGAVLARSAAVVDVFVRRRMACPGCAMAPYMTIAEAAVSYGLDPELLVSELEAALRGPEG
jgi:hybrid cluster-associated redox disulfide protein